MQSAKSICIRERLVGLFEGEAAKEGAFSFNNLVVECFAKVSTVIVVFSKFNYFDLGYGEFADVEDFHFIVLFLTAKIIFLFYYFYINRE